MHTVTEQCNNWRMNDRDNVSKQNRLIMSPSVLNNYISIPRRGKSLNTPIVVFVALLSTWAWAQADRSQLKWNPLNKSIKALIQNIVTLSCIQCICMAGHKAVERTTSQLQSTRFRVNSCSVQRRKNILSSNTPRPKSKLNLQLRQKHSWIFFFSCLK